MPSSWLRTWAGVAGAAGLEPTTTGFGDQSSAKLSYAPPLDRYFASRWRVCRRSRGQYFRSSSRFGSFFLFLRVVYVRSLHSVQASRITGRFSAFAIVLLDDRGDGAGADGPATFANGEAQADLEGDRGDQLDLHLDVVAGHDHLGSIGQADGAGDVGRAQVELGPVAVVERGMAATLLLGQDVDLGGELGVGLDRAGLGHDLAALDVVALDAPQQAAHVVPGAALVEELLEHLDAGHDDLAGGLDPDDLALVADVDDASLDAPGGHGAPALDPEDILDRHQEGLVDGPLGGRDVGIDRVHQLLDRDIGRIVGIVAGLEGFQRGAPDDRDVVNREVGLAEELTDLELDEVEQLRVIDRVDLVEEDDDERDLDLAGQQDVLAGLEHRAIGGGHDQDRAVHLGGAGDHVLDVVGMARAVDVGVVPVGRLVLDVGDRDRDPPLAVFGGVVDRVEGAILRPAFQGEVLGDRRGQAGLAVVDVTDRADIDVRLGPLELLLRHVSAFTPSRDSCPTSGT